MSHTVTCHQDVSFLTVISDVQLNNFIAGLQEISCFALIPLFIFLPFTVSAKSVKSSFAGSSGH